MKLEPAVITREGRFQLNIRGALKCICFEKTEMSCIRKQQKSLLHGVNVVKLLARQEICFT